MVYLSITVVVEGKAGVTTAWIEEMGKDTGREMLEDMVWLVTAW